MKHNLIYIFLLLSLNCFAQSEETVDPVAVSAETVETEQVKQDKDKADKKKDNKKEKDKKSKEKKEGKQAKEKEKKPTVEGLTAQLEAVQAELKTYKDKEALIDSKLAEAARLEENAKNENAKQENAVKEAETLKAELQTERRNIDEFIVTYCYIRLTQRYNAKWEAEALELWDKIKTKDLMEAYKAIPVYLRSYKDYYMEVRQVIQDAQDDEKGRTWKDAASDFAKVYISKIHNTSYYKSCYNQDIPIMFLNRQIDLFDKMLKETPKGHYDFGMFLKYFFPAVQ